MKIKLYLVLGLTLFSFACQIKQTNFETTSEKNVVDSFSQTFSIVDSLEKYYSADSVLLIDDAVGATLFIGKASSSNYAVFVIPDSILVFFQHRTDEQWRNTDILIYKLDFSFSDYIDLNGDGFKDIRVSSISGAAGNLENRVFLFENKTNSFRHNEYYDLPNIEYDSKNNFIKSWWFSGVVHCQEKWKYKITGDSLTFDLGASYCPDEETQGETATIDFFKKAGDQKIITKRLSGKSDNLWGIFEQAFWDTSIE